MITYANIVDMEIDTNTVVN